MSTVPAHGPHTLDESPLFGLRMTPFLRLPPASHLQLATQTGSGSHLFAKSLAAFVAFHHQQFRKRCLMSHIQHSVRGLTGVIL